MGIQTSALNGSHIFISNYIVLFTNCNADVGVPNYDGARVNDRKKNSPPFFQKKAEFFFLHRFSKNIRIFFLFLPFTLAPSYQTQELDLVLV